MIDTMSRVQLFDIHNNGNHLQEKQNDCLFCTSLHMVNPSNSEILDIYQYIKDVLWSAETVFPSVKYAYQLLSNLDVSLREKIFDEARHGRTIK